MLGRDDIIDVVQQTLADVAGLDAADVALDSSLDRDLGLEEDEYEDVVAQLQSVLEIQLAPAELFPDDDPEEWTVQSIVDAVAIKIVD